MSSTNHTSRRDHALLIADGFLLTIGTGTVALSIPFGLPLLIGDDAFGGVLMEAGSGILMLVGGLSGVVLAWVLNGRRINGPAIAGGLFGAALGGAMIPLMAGISFLLGLPLKPFTDSEFAGPLALLVLGSIAVTVLFVWMLTDAARDLAPERRTHVKLDKARIAAVTVFVVLVAISVYMVFAQPGPEQGEAPIFAIAGGLIGAGVIAGADVANILAERQRHATPTGRTA